MTKVRSRHYQDFVIGTPSWLLYSVRPLFWLLAKFGKQRSVRRFYGTSIRRVGKNKIEVTFELPPTIKQQMHKAIAAGKQIRLFVI